MTPSAAMFAGASAALAIALATGLPRPDRKVLTSPLFVTAAALFLVSLLVRALAVLPTLVHADVVAPELVDCVLQFPRECTGRGATYGQYGFLLLGALTRLFGADLSALFRASQIVGAIDVALIAVLAQRLSGSAFGGLLAVAITATNPIFLRVAASEDMHNVGLLLGLVALIAMDVFATTRRTASLVAALLALVLMVHTRQTFYAFAPCVFLLGVARGGRAILTDGRFWGAAALAAAALAGRVAGSSDTENLRGNMLMVFAQPILIPTLFRFHPLFDFARFGILPFVTVVGIALACFGNRVTRATVAIFAVNFLVTYPCGMPSPGVELAQRLSAYATAALTTAVACTRLLEDHVPAAFRIRIGIPLAAFLFAVPPLFQGWTTVSTLTPVHREYRAVEAAAARLPEQLTLVNAVNAEAVAGGHARYASLLERVGKTVHVVSSPDGGPESVPAFFLESIECWTFSFHEVAGVSDKKEAVSNAPVRWDHVLFGGERSPLRPPAGPRPECRPYLRPDSVVEPQGSIHGPPDDPPFLFYSTDEVPVRFHRLR